MAAKKPEIPSLATFVEKIKSGELFKEIQNQVLSSQIWTSSFRHGYADTPRNRVLQIASNVWLHLHPV
ncbi:MAG TPA: cytochrome B6, partial [Nitrospinaceae bacterium]|nr:cytochrome B6 [Nitrospinaceae bacterium]